MFKLHERTRLLFCRLGFLILCGVPTLFLGGAAWRYRSPSYLEARREEWCAVLSDKLGLDVHVQKLSYPHWNTALLEGFMLVDPETSEEVVGTRYVEVAFENGRWQIVLGQPEVNAEALPLLTELLDHRLLRGQALQFAPISLQTRQLTFRSVQGAQTFEQVAVEIVTTESGKRIDARFQAAGQNTPPAEFTLQRRRGEGSPRTTCTLRANEPFPCGVLSPLWPWISQLGDEATFTGEVSLDRSTPRPSANLVGRFEQVELARLFSGRSSQRQLAGRASIDFTSLELHDGTLTEAKGTLQAHGGGVVSYELLQAIASRLDLTPPEAPRLRSEPLVRFSHLAFGFQLDAQGLSLTGSSDPSGEGVIMASAAAGPLLVESSRAVVPAVNLVEILSSGNEGTLPTSPEAKGLLNLLPAETNTKTELPRARVRLRE